MPPFTPLSPVVPSKRKSLEVTLAGMSEPLNVVAPSRAESAGAALTRVAMPNLRASPSMVRVSSPMFRASATVSETADTLAVLPPVQSIAALVNFTVPELDEKATGSDRSPSLVAPANPAPGATKSLPSGQIGVLKAPRLTDPKRSPWLFSVRQARFGVDTRHPALLDATRSSPATLVEFRSKPDRFPATPMRPDV